jgi:ribokinase
MNTQYDFIAIGDTVIDAFIKLADGSGAEVVGEPSHKNYKICLPFAEKVPYEEVYVLNAVGNAPNGAVSASRLGLKTAIISNVGGDQNGKDCLESFTKDGVGTEFIKTNDGMKTNYHYVLWFGSERTILIKHETYPYELPDIGEPKWIYFSSVSKNAFPFHNTVADYLESHPRIKLAFQPGKNEIKLGKDKLAKLYQHAEVLFCNVEEAQEILETKEDTPIQELLKGLHGLGSKIVVITDGPRGAHASDGTEMWFMPPYPDVSAPVERTGAGDAFASTFSAALALGKTVPEALAWGPVNSMSVVQHVGAQEGLLTREKLEEFIQNAPESYKPQKIS